MMLTRLGRQWITLDKVQPLHLAFTAPARSGRRRAGAWLLGWASVLLIILALWK